MPLAGARIKASDLDFPVTQVRSTGATSITNNAYTSVNFATEDYDDDGMHSTVTNTSRLTAVRAGRYQLDGAAGFVSNATGRRGAQFAVNGTAINASQTLLAAFTSAGGIDVPCRGVVVTLAVGDFVELQAFQDSGGALNTNTSGSGQCSLTARYLGTG